MADELLFTTFRFDVQLELDNPGKFGLPQTLCDAAFSEVDGLEMTMEPKTIREGGNNSVQTHLVGPVSYGNLTLKRGMTSTLHLWEWFSLAANGNGEKENSGRGAKARGLITMRDMAGNAQLYFKLRGCLPIKMKAPPLNAADGLVAIEEMQIAYGSFEVALP
jgi:phage tail-like protein